MQEKSEIQRYGSSSGTRRVAHTFRQMNGAQKPRRLANAPLGFLDALQKYHHSLASQLEISTNSGKNKGPTFHIT
jgi:hypothetical protein